MEDLVRGELRVSSTSLEEVRGHLRQVSSARLEICRYGKGTSIHEKMPTQRYRLEPR